MDDYLNVNGLSLNGECKFIIRLEKHRILFEDHHILVVQDATLFRIINTISTGYDDNHTE